MSRALKVGNNNSVIFQRVEIQSYSEPAKLVQIDNASATLESYKEPPSLVITEEFRVGLERKLAPSNFKSLAYKQDEFNQIMWKLESPFNLFYLFEKYSNEFNLFNLMKFTNKMAFFKRTFSDDFFIPMAIKKAYTKLVIKDLPHFLSQDCFSLFKQLVYLDFGLDDPALKATMQILKYHVNELKINELITIKKLLNKSKSQSKNEYIEPLEKAVSLAVQLKLDDLDVTDAVSLLKTFANDLSPNNVDKLVAFLHLNFKQLNLPEVVDLLVSLSERKYTHVKLCQKIAKLIMRNTSSVLDVKVIRVLKRRYETEDESEVKSRVLNEFLRCSHELKFYDGPTFDFVCDYQMSRLNSLLDKTDPNSNHMVEVLLKAFSFFNHKRFDLIEFIDNHPVKIHSDFNIAAFITYAGLIQYKNIKETDFERLSGFKCENDEDELKLIRSLCWLSKTDLARQRLNCLVAPQDMSFENKLFIHDVFNINYFKENEEFPSRSKLEEKLEQFIKEFENGRYELVPNNTSMNNLNYFINYSIVDKVENKTAFLLIAKKKEEIRNLNDETGSLAHKKQNIKKQESNLLILRVKELQNLNDDAIKEKLFSKLKNIAFSKK